MELDRISQQCDTRILQVMLQFCMHLIDYLLLHFEDPDEVLDAFFSYESTREEELRRTDALMEY